MNKIHKSYNYLFNTNNSFVNKKLNIKNKDNI